MPRRDTAQLNIRSAFARDRTREISRLTGMTATEIIEDALRGYVAPAAPDAVGRLVRHGRLLVLPAAGATLTLDDANLALDETRSRELF